MSSHQEKLLNAINRFYEGEKFCDVTIICGAEEERAADSKSRSTGLEHDETLDYGSPSGSADEYRVSFGVDSTKVAKLFEIRCHKIVLCALSDYFAAMFNLNMKESSESRVMLDSIPYGIMRSIVNFAYYGEIKLSVDNAMDTALVANFLQVSELVELCSAFLVESLTMSNSILTFQLARENNLVTLTEAALTFILDNFVSILNCVEDDINQCLTADAFEDVIKSDMLNVPNEAAVFEVVLNWVKSDHERRQYLFVRMLEHVRLPFISSQLLRDQKSHNWLLQSSSEAISLLTSVIDSLSENAAKSTRILPSQNPRPSTLDTLVVIGGLEPNSTGPNYMERYSPRENVWARSEVEMPRAQVMFSSVEVNGNIFVIGGRNALKTLGNADCYDNSGKELDDQFPRMHTCRQGLSTCVLDERSIYAIGGHDGWNYLNSVEVLDLENIEQGWITAKSMKTTRSNSACAVIEDRIYVLGGRDGSSCLSSMEMYDSKANKWSYCASMHKRRAHASAVALAGFIYVMGGTDSQSSVFNNSAFDSCERYNPVEDSWTWIASLPSPRRSMACCVLGNEVYVIGGYSDQSETASSVYKYNPNLNQWKQVADLTSYRVGARCVVLKKDS